MAGANDASLFPANQKGARVLPFQRQTERRLLCLPVLRTDFRPTTLSVFLPLIYPPTRSTLRDNRIQRERWGSYTIFTLRTAKKGLSVPVSIINLYTVPVITIIAEKRRHIVYIIFDS